MGFNYLFIYFSSGYVALWDSKTCHRPSGESVSWCLKTSRFFKTHFPGQISIPTSFVSLFIFYILSYLLSKTMDAFLGAWCPLPVFKVVLWNLLSVQMFFQWICQRESDFPVLFLHHLRTTPQNQVSNGSLIPKFYICFVDYCHSEIKFLEITQNL